MRGSCLCGRCVFQIPDAPGPINKCHCSRCRKVSGTASNAVFWIEPDALRWIAGEDAVRTHRLADGWESVFCGTCGSPLPRLIPDEEWIVPAGLMDEAADVGIRQHLFVDELPAWEIIGDDAPRFARVPAD